MKALGCTIFFLTSLHVPDCCYTLLHLSSENRQPVLASADDVVQQVHIRL